MNGNSPEEKRATAEHNARFRTLVYIGVCILVAGLYLWSIA